MIIIIFSFYLLIRLFLYFFGRLGIDVYFLSIWVVGVLGVFFAVRESYRDIG